MKCSNLEDLLSIYFHREDEIELYVPSPSMGSFLVFPSKEPKRVLTISTERLSVDLFSDGSFKVTSTKVTEGQL